MTARRAAIVVLATLLAPSGTQAVQQGVTFDATVAAVCTLTVNSNGTMVPAPDLATLSSKLGGGSPATLTLSTTGGVNLSLDPVTAVTVPAADNTSTTWTPTYSAAGAHAIAETGSSNALAGPGVSAVTVHLVGTKGGSDRFAKGNYQATVTVRCE